MSNEKLPLWFWAGVATIVGALVALTTWFCLLAYAAEHICP